MGVDLCLAVHLGAIASRWCWSPRKVLDAILYTLRVGYAWRHLPRDSPPWFTAYRWFLRLSRVGMFEQLAHVLAMADRERARSYYRLNW